MALMKSYIFNSPYDQYKARTGQEAILVRSITTADDKHDAEVLPMYEIQFEDGETIEAYSEELQSTKR